MPQRVAIAGFGAIGKVVAERLNRGVSARHTARAEPRRSGGLAAGAETGHRHGHIGAGGGEVHALAN
jgi:hypothetical protein